MTAVATDIVPEIRPVRRGLTLPRLTGVELRKMLDTRAGFWLMASILITALLATGAVILFAPEEDLTYVSFATAIGFPMTVILPLIAVLSVTSEWSQRSGLTTFTLIPHRSRAVGAKALASLVVAVVSMLLAFTVGATGNVIGATVAGTDLVWDVSVVEGLSIVLGNVLGVAMGFALGMLIRSSPGAIVGCFVYAFIAPTLFGLLAASQEWFSDLQPWIDFHLTQTALFEGALSAQQWAHLGVAGVLWLVVPLLLGLRVVLRSEVT